MSPPKSALHTRHTYTSGGMGIRAEAFGWKQQSQPPIILQFSYRFLLMTLCVPHTHCYTVLLHICEYNNIHVVDAALLLHLFDPDSI